MRRTSRHIQDTSARYSMSQYGFLSCLESKTPLMPFREPRLQVAGLFTHWVGAKRNAEQ
jgi:hypothetical protein